MSAKRTGAPCIGALVLAAGRSSRMAPAQKLLLPLGDRTLLAHAVDNVLASAVVSPPVLVVVPDLAGPIARSLDPRTVRVIAAPDAGTLGMSASLRVGIAALPGELDAILVALGDMPLIRPETIRRLAARFGESERAGRPIVLPSHRGRHGHPVLWDASHAPALRTLTGDAGGKALMRAEPAGVVIAVDTDDAGILFDIDDPADLARAHATVRS